jgi:hypothetical protein
MVFDRISLIRAYDVLKLTQDNDGNVKNILLNKSSKYGTKTMPRFRDLEHLREFINTKYPYVLANECSCATSNESIWNVLAFEIYSRPEDLEGDIVDENNKRRDIKVQAASKHATFVNNIRRDYQSQKSNFQNNSDVKQTDTLFKKDIDLQRLFDNYVCFPYIENQGNYIDPCDYIEILKDVNYETIIEKHYKPTRRKDFPTQIVLFNSNI